MVRPIKSGQFRLANLVLANGHDDGGDAVGDDGGDGGGDDGGDAGGGDDGGDDGGDGGGDGGGGDGGVPGERGGGHEQLQDKLAQLWKSSQRPQLSHQVTLKSQQVTY